MIIIPGSDNSPLPELFAASAQSDFQPPAQDQVSKFIADSISPRTKRAYRLDLRHFIAWGGAVPCNDALVADYIASHAGRLAVATLVRRLASISKAHRIVGLQSPTGSELVRATLRGVKRRYGVKQDQARPLLLEDLIAVVSIMDDSLKAKRDRALLLLGFAGGFRRSELVGLDCCDVQEVKEGMIVVLQRSKTDQLGEGRKLGIPYGRTKWCPVFALRDWLIEAKIDNGSLFRSISGSGDISPKRLSGEAVSVIMKARVARAGYDPGPFSGHSLRAGFATSAARAGVSSWKIRAQTGHRSDAMLARYVRDGELFVGNAASALL